MKTLQQFKRFAYLAADVLVIILSYLTALFLNDSLSILPGDLEALQEGIVLILLVYLLVFYINDIYNKVWRQASLDEGIQLFGAVLGGNLLILALDLSTGYPLGLDVHIVAGVLIFFLAGAYRYSYRVLRNWQLSRSAGKGQGRRVLIIGAGQAGLIMAREMQQNPGAGYRPVAFADDDPGKLGKTVAGLTVAGSREDIPALAARYKAEIILLAINHLEGRDKREILGYAKETECTLKIMPDILTVMGQGASLASIRDVDLGDLLGRDPVVLDTVGIREYLADKVVLVTGAAGSIGSQLCRDIAAYGPRELICLDAYENGIFDLQEEFRGMEANLTFLVGSIRDPQRMERIFREYRPEVVFHAAALKHVPVMEANPGEAVRTNILGTRLLARLASRYGVRRFVQISTDKAVNPVNVMGATKRACEIYLGALNQESGTEFCAVRFGNVLGSNGSVVPIFLEQIRKGGPVTLTHRKMTRFFMTIPEASQLVLQAGAFAKGGELFILDMGEPMGIYDLAQDLIRLAGLVPERDIPIQEVGLRPGEKLHEELLRSDEEVSMTANRKIYVAQVRLFPLEEIDEKLDRLEELLPDAGKRELDQALAALVPSYVPMPS